MTENPYKTLVRERENMQKRFTAHMNQRWKEYCATNGIEPCGEVVYRPNNSFDWEKETERIAEMIAKRTISNDNNQRSE